MNADWIIEAIPLRLSDQKPGPTRLKTTARRRHKPLWWLCSLLATCQLNQDRPQELPCQVGISLAVSIRKRKSRLYK